MQSNIVFTPKGQTLPTPTHGRRGSDKPVGSLPLILDSSGHPHWPATDWIIWMAIKGRKSGTLQGYGYAIASFVRFLDSCGATINDMSDGLFYDYAHFLMQEEGRSGNYANNTMRRAISFLLWAQETQRIEPHTIGVGAGFRVRLEKRQFSRRRARKSSSKPDFFYSHHAIPKRRPMPPPSAATTEEIDALWEAASNFPSTFRRQRAYVILEILEMSGIRRSELVKIKVSDIEAAQASGTLSITTSKHIDSPIRQVPIHPDALERAMFFIEHFRSEKLQTAIRTGRLAHDHGFLFITARGTPYSERSVTAEFRALCDAAGLEKGVSPHSLRRRFNTKLLHATANTADLRNGIPHSLRLIIKAVMGWKTDEMLELYFDQNLNEIEQVDNYFTF
jgi:integrase/recombinase XerD